MKKLLIAFFVLMTVLASCDKEDIEKVARKNEKKVTIQTGLWGTLSFREGNCMPGSKKNCREVPAIRQIRIYSKTRIADVVFYNSQRPTFFENFQTTLIQQLDTDEEGFFQVALPPGDYTLVAVENDLLYANSFQGTGTEAIINPFTIQSGQATRVDFIIDYNAVY